MLKTFEDFQDMSFNLIQLWQQILSIAPSFYLSLLEKYDLSSEQVRSQGFFDNMAVDEKEFMQRELSTVVQELDSSAAYKRTHGVII